MEWATTEDVTEITGHIVTAPTLAIARGIVETLTGLFESIERPDISDRDLEWLKRAVAYQAAFVKDNPDLFSRIDVTNASQDGEAVTFRNVDAHLLAPLARKCIRRLSWRQATRPEDRAAERRRLNVLSEEYDDSLAWKRM